MEDTPKIRLNEQGYKVSNVQDIEEALGKIGKVSGVTYDWITDGEHDIGLIAEEVGAVFPEAVIFDEDGEGALAVDYMRLVPVLVEAIKEQQVQIEDLRTRITALEGRATHS